MGDSIMKKFFKIILVGFMLTTGMFTTVYAESDENDENTEVLPFFRMSAFLGKCQSAIIIPLKINTIVYQI